MKKFFVFFLSFIYNIQPAYARRIHSRIHGTYDEGTLKFALIIFSIFIVLMIWEFISSNAAYKKYKKKHPHNYLRGSFINEVFYEMIFYDMKNPIISNIYNIIRFYATNGEHITNRKELINILDTKFLITLPGFENTKITNMKLIGLTLEQIRTDIKNNLSLIDDCHIWEMHDVIIENLNGYMLKDVTEFADRSGKKLEVMRVTTIKQIYYTEADKKENTK